MAHFSIKKITENFLKNMAKKSILDKKIVK
jgi:hypothetical protein